MSMWEPHDPVSFFAHIIFGVLAYSAGLLAVSSTKGSTIHIRAGWIFSLGMMVAAITPRYSRGRC